MVGRHGPPVIRCRDDHRHPADYLRRADLRQAGLRRVEPRRVDRRPLGDFRLDHYPAGFQRLNRVDRQASANYRSSAECLGDVRPID
jgi:hypothetical protein